MKTNHKELREMLTMMFGSCPLTDEFIDREYEICYYAICAEAECALYMKNELKMPYTEKYQKDLEKYLEEYDEDKV